MWPPPRSRATSIRLSTVLWIVSCPCVDGANQLSSVARQTSRLPISGGNRFAHSHFSFLSVAYRAHASAGVSGAPPAVEPPGCAAGLASELTLVVGFGSLSPLPSRTEPGTVVVDDFEPHPSTHATIASHRVIRR
jgi:hypothetical protein